MYFLVRFTSSHHCLIMNDLPGLKSLLVSAELYVYLSRPAWHMCEKKNYFEFKFSFCQGRIYLPFFANNQAYLKKRDKT